MRPITGKTLVKLSALSNSKATTSAALFGEFFTALFAHVIEPGPYDVAPGATFVDFRRMLRGDLIAAFLFASSAASDGPYKFAVPCQADDCRKKIGWSINLARDLKAQKLPASSIARLRENLPFDADADGVPVKFRLQQPSQEEWLVKWLEQNERKQPSLTDRLYSQVVSYGDIPPHDHKRRWDAFSDLPLPVLRKLAKQFAAVDCGVDTAIQIQCPHVRCRQVQRVNVPLDPSAMFMAEEDEETSTSLETTEQSSTESSESIYDPNGAESTTDTSSTDLAK